MHNFSSSCYPTAENFYLDAMLSLTVLLLFLSLILRASEQVSSLNTEVSSLLQQLEPLRDDELVQQKDLATRKSQLNALRDKLNEAKTRVELAEKKSIFDGRRKGENWESKMEGSEDWKDCRNERKEGESDHEAKLMRMKERCRVSSLNRTAQQESTIRAYEVLL